MRRGMSPKAKFFIALLALVVIFAIVVLIYGSIQGMNFWEVLQHWFGGASPDPEGAEAALRAVF